MVSTNSVMGCRSMHTVPVKYTFRDVPRRTAYSVDHFALDVLWYSQSS
jgi:hypothetical protein